MAAAADASRLSAASRNCQGDDGDHPTLADCYLVPQIYNARRFAVDLAPFPHLVAAAAAVNELDAFLAARPEAQPDADI